MALEDGYRESTDSWATVLRDLRRRRMRPPVIAVGDGALGFWATVRNVRPDTQAQRDRCHKLRNVLGKLPKWLQAKATRAQADQQLNGFVAEYAAKYPKATASRCSHSSPWRPNTGRTCA